MTHPRSYLTTFVLLVFTALAGCGNDLEVVEKNTRPFSFAGIHLGMETPEMKNAVAIAFCDTHSASEAMCFLDDESKKYAFFGIDTKNQNVILIDPYMGVDRINFSFDGRSGPDLAQITHEWQLEGRCFTGYEIDDLGRQLNDLAINVIIRGFGEISARPYERDFSCLSDDGAFLKVLHSDDGGYVQMYYLKDTITEMYEKLFNARNRLQAAELRQQEALDL